MKRIALALVLLVGCGAPTTHVAMTRIPPSSAPNRSHLASEAEVTTSTEHASPSRASRSRTTVRPRVAVPQPAPRPAVVANGGDFWRRLANCESPDGRSGRFLGYFQFSRDTARKVGWYDGASYEAQVGMAQRWLAMIGGRGGSRSGWPVCWWRAGGR